MGSPAKHIGNWKHGETMGHRPTAEYKAWCAMIERCQSNHPASKNYYRRGITVCERWKHSFPNFLTDMGRKPSPRLTLDRIDNDGNYEPGNCRWATREEQGRNKRSNRLITFRGETLCMADWSRRTGLHPMTLRRRLSAGWPVERALTQVAVIGANGS